MYKEARLIRDDFIQDGWGNFIDIPPYYTLEVGKVGMLNKSMGLGLRWIGTVTSSSIDLNVDIWLNRYENNQLIATHALNPTSKRTQSFIKTLDLSTQRGITRLIVLINEYNNDYDEWTPHQTGIKMGEFYNLSNLFLDIESNTLYSEFWYIAGMLKKHLTNKKN